MSLWPNGFGNAWKSTSQISSVGASRFRVAFRKADPLPMFSLSASFATVTSTCALSGRWCQARYQQFPHVCREFCDGPIDRGLWETPFDPDPAADGGEASENVTVAFPGQDTAPARFSPGSRWYRTATTEYRPNRHGAARTTVRRDRPRVVSTPTHDRHSWDVISIDQRPPYVPTTASAVRPVSVVNRYSSRWVPVASLTHTHRIGTSPLPPLYNTRSRSPPRPGGCRRRTTRR